jgi:hypothetical protein
MEEVGGVMGLFDIFKSTTPAGLITAATSGAAQGTLGAIGQTARDLRAAITGEDPIDAAAAAELAVKAQQIEADILLAQAKINEAEARSTNRFASSWRPALGWTCVTGIAIEFIVRPLADWIAALCGTTVATPTLDVGQLIALVVSMLGIAAYRTVEKANGTVGIH